MSFIVKRLSVGFKSRVQIWIRPYHTIASNPPHTARHLMLCYELPSVDTEAIVTLQTLLCCVASVSPKKFQYDTHMSKRDRLYVILVN